MKKRVPILNNEIFSKILFIINKREIYASQIASELNKTQATTQRQLTFLVKENYLIIKEHPEKKKNIKLFSIDWQKIVEEFLKEVKNARDETLKQLSEKSKESLKKELQYKQGKDFNIIYELDKKEFVNNLKNNKYLLLYLQNFFSKLGEMNSNYTLSQAFSFIILVGNFNFIKTFQGVRLNLGYVLEMTREFKFDFEFNKKNKQQKKENFQRNIQEETKRINKRIEEVKKDKELIALFRLNDILQISRLIPVLRKAMYSSEDLISIKVLSKYINKEEFEGLKDKINKGILLPFSDIDEKLLEEIEKSKEIKQL